MDSTDSTNTPQAEPVAPQEVPPTTPEVQEAEAAVNLPKPGSRHFPKPFLIGLIVLFILIIVGVVGNYFLIAKYTSDTNSQPVSAESESTKVMISPTPINEQDEIDKIDTTFPEADVNGIQTDLQGL